MAFDRRSLELTPEQWAVLDRIAAQTSSFAPSGPSAGQPSWRTLIERIAERKMEVTAKSTQNDDMACESSPEASRVIR
jgi:hypothetical protein